MLQNRGNSGSSLYLDVFHEWSIGSEEAKLDVCREGHYETMQTPRAHLAHLNLMSERQIASCIRSGDISQLQPMNESQDWSGALTDSFPYHRMYARVVT